MLWLFVVEYTQTYHLLFILHYITIIYMYIHIKSYPHNCCSIYLYRNPQKPWIIFIPLHISSYMFTSTLDCGLARIQKPLGVPCAIEAEKVRAVFMANGEWRGVKMIGTGNPNPTRWFERTNPNTVFCGFQQGQVAPDMHFSIEVGGHLCTRVSLRTFWVFVQFSVGHTVTGDAKVYLPDMPTVTCPTWK